MKKIILKQNAVCSVADELTALELPVCGRVAAGYPAEAYNYIEDPIDMNKYILGIKDDEKFKNKEGREVYDGKNRKYIKCVWATNRKMTGEGIGFGDLLVIDTNKKPHKDSVILYFLDDEFILARCKVYKDRVELVLLCGDQKPIVYAGDCLTRIGVLTYVVKKFPCHNNSYNNYPEDASGYIAGGMNFNKYIIGDNYWETHFYLRAGGDSMAGDGIHKDDLLTVDKLRESFKESIIVFHIFKTSP